MQLNIEKFILNENSNEKKDLVIFNENVGTYNWGLFSKWYISYIDKTGKSIPNIGKYVCGLLCKEFLIDIKDINTLRLIEQDIQKEFKDIGQWFEEKVLKND